MKKNIPVFVYGSLRKGMHLHSYMGKSKLVGFGYVDGYTLHSLGSFPGINAGEPDNRLYGELYMVNDEVLADLDHIEGYRADEQAYNFYNRVKETAVIDGNEHKCFLYVYAKKLDRAVISGGDWVKYNSPPRQKAGVNG